MSLSRARPYIMDYVFTGPHGVFEHTLARVPEISHSLSRQHARNSSKISCKSPGLVFLFIFQQVSQLLKYKESHVRPRTLAVYSCSSLHISMCEFITRNAYHEIQKTQCYGLRCDELKKVTLSFLNFMISISCNKFTNGFFVSQVYG